VAQTFNSSTSTLTKITCGSFFASSARKGAMKRHGPHHEAVKSTTICPGQLYSSAEIEIKHKKISEQYKLKTLLAGVGLKVPYMIFG